MKLINPENSAAVHRENTVLLSIPSVKINP